MFHLTPNRRDRWRDDDDDDRDEPGRGREQPLPHFENELEKKIFGALKHMIIVEIFLFFITLQKEMKQTNSSLSQTKRDIRKTPLSTNCM
jgi:hypothetical protein